MAFAYDSIEASARRLIREFGQDTTLSVVTQGTIAADGASRTGDTTATQTVKAVVDSFLVYEIDGEQILVDDKKIMLSAKDTSGVAVVQPVAGKDNLTVGGIKHEIQRVLPLNPGGTAVLYQLQVRI